MVSLPAEGSADSDVLHRFGRSEVRRVDDLRYRWACGGW
jgi:hypothetical protein